VDCPDGGAHLLGIASHGYGHGVRQGPFAVTKEWNQTEVVSREVVELGVTFESAPGW
jgi:hypothetical protein